MTARRTTALLFLLAGLGLSTFALAQVQGSITGRVIDHDGKPIEGATVTLAAQGSDLEVSTTTNRKETTPSGRRSTSIEPNRWPSSTGVVKVSPIGHQVVGFSPSP